MMSTEPITVLVQQAPDKARLILDCCQVIGTAALVWAAAKQASAARAQSQAADDQAKAASAQMEMSEISLSQAIKPRFVPQQRNETEKGTELLILNVGPGTAYAIRWQIDKQQHWSEGEDAVAANELTRIELHMPNETRKVIVQYYSVNKELYTTEFETPLFSHKDPASHALVPDLRRQQRGQG